MESNGSYARKRTEVILFPQKKTLRFGAGSGLPHPDAIAILRFPKEGELAAIPGNGS